MKKLITAVALALISFDAIAQTDSLRLLLRNAKHDTTRCNLLLAIGESMYTNQPDSALAYWIKADKLSKDFISKNSPCKTVVRKMKNLRANTLNNIAYIYDNKGNIAFALDHYNASLRILEELKDSLGLGYAYNNLGIVYRNQGDLKNAKIYLEKSLKIRRDSRDLAGEAQSLTNVGSLYMFSGQPDSARSYYSKSISIRENNGDKNGLAYSYQFMGDYFILKRLNDSALNYFNRSLKIRKLIGDKRGTAYSLNRIGNILLKQNKYKDALTVGLENYNIATSMRYPELIKSSSELLKNVYLKLNDLKKAIEMYDIFISMKDSVSNESTRKATARQQLKYEFEKKAAEDSVAYAKEKELKETEIALQKAELKVKRNEQYVLYGGLIFVLLLTLFIYNRFKVTQKQKSIIENKNIIIEQKQREILDSINYAKRIQRAHLPTDKYIEKSINKLKS